jgi:hypothetical protein
MSFRGSGRQTVSRRCVRRGLGGPEALAKVEARTLPGLAKTVRAPDLEYRIGKLL